MAHLISRRLVALFLVVLITTGLSQTPRSGNAGQGNAVNPINFSIKGLRLHMTADEARPIMEQLAAENSSRVENSHVRCVLEQMSALREHQEISRDGRGNCVESMDYSPRGAFRVELEFVEDLPKSPGTMRLWHIGLEQGKLATEADIKSFLSAVIEKYGPATFATPSEISYCSETGPAKTCRINSIYDRTTVKLMCSTFGVAVGCQFPSQLGRVGFYARAEYHGVRIDLYDAAFASQSAHEEAKMIGDTRTTAKPSL